MKRKICMALSVMMILVTLLVPMTSWAEPDKDDSSTEKTQTEQSADTSKDDTSSSEKTEKKSESSKTEKKTEEKSSTKEKAKTEENNKTNNTYRSYSYYQNAASETESNISKGTISIMFTHDIHSHLDAEMVTSKGKTSECGGIARAVTVFKEISPAYKDDSFVLDAGDFSMGTGYQTVFLKEAVEFRMLGFMGYDAVTLGNHEFDYGSDGLASMLNVAVKKTEEENEKQPSVYNWKTFKYEKEEISLPKICISNIDWDGSLAKEDGAKELQKAFKKCKAEEDYTVIKKNGIKIAVFGIMGQNSDECATESGLAFSDQIETAKKVVENIKANEKDVKLIVCLSHSGTDSNPEASEDELLAKAVPDIDLIISGHTHTSLEEPITVGNTVIASAGEFTSNVGYVTFTKNKKSGEYEMKKYKLYELSSKVEEDADTLKQLEGYKELVDDEYFKKYGYTLDEVIAENDIEFSTTSEFAQKQGEETLGNLYSDAYRYAVKKVEGQEPDVAVVPRGVVRGSLPKGKITASIAFNTLSSGVGADGSAAEPLVKMYLTGRELKNIAEVDATVSDSMLDARLYLSGMSYKINTHRLMLNRAFDIELTDGKKTEAIDNSKLYSVVTDRYTAQMLAGVNDKSKGLISIIPKDENGVETSDIDKYVINNGKLELKAWQAVAMYLEKMGTVSSKYEKADGRKIVSDSKNIREIICQPNKVGWMLRGAIILVLVIILLIILLINRKKISGRTRRKKGSMTYTVSERQKKAIFAPPKKQKNLFADNGRRSRRNRRNGRY